MKSTTTLSAALLLLFAVLTLPQDNVYSLRFSEDQPRSVHVTATLKQTQDTLLMVPWGHPNLEHGWGTFVENLVITDFQGQAVSAVEAGNGTWILENPPAGGLQLSYTVSLTHDQHDWSAGGGEDSRPLVLTDSLFIITKALIIGHQDMGSSAITIHVPDTWQISTTWSPGGDSYTASDFYQLADNMLVVGRHQHCQIKAGEMDVIFAMAPELQPFEDRIIEVFSAILPQFQSMFSDTPDVRYLVALTVGGFPDGEAFQQSFHQIMNPGMIQGGEMVWANGLAHEMLHYWIGAGLLVPADPEELNYVTEGFTEYLTNLALVRADIIDRRTFFVKLARHFSRYFVTSRMYGPAESLAEAGKAKHRNWQRVYGGGAALAFCLDMDIRRRTASASGLEDVIARLIASVGGRENLTLDHILAAAEHVSGHDYGTFFQQYAYQVGPMLDLFQAPATVGLNVYWFADEFYLRERGDMTPETRQALESWLGNTP